MQQHPRPPASKGAGSKEDKGGGKGKFKGGAKAAKPACGASVPCKFFGSAKGCSNDACGFSHDEPNSVQPCSFKQRRGYCDRGEACTFRHVPWTSAEQARAHYASRGQGVVLVSIERYKQLHRDTGDSPSKPSRLAKEHVEMPTEKEVEKDIHEEMYGSKAMRMMEKMGYKAGVGLGKQELGGTKLADPCLMLERASQKASLGVGNFDPDLTAKPAERAARLADARAQKRTRVEGSSVVVHNLLSDDDSSDDEDKHTKVRNVQL